METRALPAYLVFREVFSRQDLNYFRNALINQHELGRRGFLETPLQGSANQLMAYVYLTDKNFWLLGGNIRRKGEPTPEYMERIREAVREIERGQHEDGR